MKNARDSGGRTLKDILNKKLAYIPTKRFSKWEEEDIRMILKAEECFKHQLIFNTKTKNIEPLAKSLKISVVAFKVFSEKKSQIMIFFQNLYKENYPDDMTGADFAHCGNLDDHSNLETIDAHVKMDGQVKKEPVQNKLDLSVNKERVTSVSVLLSNQIQVQVDRANQKTRRKNKRKSESSLENNVSKKHKDESWKVRKSTGSSVTGSIDFFH